MIYVSYHSTDVAWARWLEWQLGTLGEEPKRLAWAGVNDRVAQLKAALADGAKVLLVLSIDYVVSAETKAEYQLAEAATLDNLNRLLPVRVRAFEDSPFWLHPSLRIIDLSECAQDTAAARLQEVLQGSGAPTVAPPFPGGTPKHASPPDRRRTATPDVAPAFPGVAAPFLKRALAPVLRVLTGATITLIIVFLVAWAISQRWQPGPADLGPGADLRPPPPSADLRPPPPADLLSLHHLVSQPAGACVFDAHSAHCYGKTSANGQPVANGIPSRSVVIEMAGFHPVHLDLTKHTDSQVIELSSCRPPDSCPGRTCQ